jgi:hypothetical protein
MLGLKPTEWRIAWSLVAAKFERGEDGRLRNARLERERAQALALVEKRRGAAKSRWRKRGNVVPLKTDVPKS